MQCTAGEAYNPAMGTISVSELESWLSGGGLVVTSSERAARAVLRAYHRARQSEGRAAWVAPAVMHWQAFVRAEWEKRVHDQRLVLSPNQELLMWRRIVAASGLPASLLDGPRRKLARLAMDAHALICSYAPDYLQPRRRAGWDQDAAVWSGWLEQLDLACQESAAVSADRIALELPKLLDNREQRQPLVLAGFDRLTTSQQRVLDAWGEWRQVTGREPASNVAFYRANNANSELAACAAWCRQVLEAGPKQRLLIIAQNAAEQRGEVERAFLRENEHGAELRVEFSLGVPLGQEPVARSAMMVLRWMNGALEEQELDWLIAGGYAAANDRETAELAAAMRKIRRRHRQRTEWSLQDFVSEAALTSRPWAIRMQAAQQRLATASSRDLRPLVWAETVSHLLETAGWPGARPMSSPEFQAARRWSQALEACGSLGFDGQRMGWNEFLAELSATLSETLFAPESEDAPILIAGPAESAGLDSDALWFLGTDDHAWPAGGRMNALLPPAVQREARMPHASAALDWELAKTVTERLLRSAPEVRFSYSAQADGADLRPSRLLMQLGLAPMELPSNLIASPAPLPIATAYEDSILVQLQIAPMDDTSKAAPVPGGSSIITAQSNCPFQAFVVSRLQAETWDAAEASLTPAERGELVHAVLRDAWAGPPHGLSSLVELRAVAELDAFVAGHARTAMARIPSRIREQMPARYLALEEQRLARLITAWLKYEQTRADFTVVGTELEKVESVDGLLLKLRLDRLDRLNDDTFLVVDYKTGTVTDRAWEMPRPEDLQLPLYACFGLEDGQVLGGLVFAKVQTGKQMCFEGRVGNALGTLLPNLGRTCALVNKPFEAEHRMEWQEEIEKLARDFIAGRADVDPRDPPATCERCGMHVLCRIQEREPAFGSDGAEVDIDA